MSQFLKVIEALTPLAWPLLLAVLLWKLFPTLKEILGSRAFSVKIGDSQISVQDATEQFRTQIEDLQRQVIQLRSDKPKITENDQASASEKPTLPPSERLPSILWVDDSPTNNAFEIAQLKEMGVNVSQAVSTEEAMALLNNSAGFDAIVSDMGRRESGGYRSQAGLILLNALRRAGYKVPFLVYSSQKYANRNREEVRLSGGDGATSSPVELLEWIGSKVRQPNR
jgi:CheY-like chemotaxis protein